MAGGAASVHVPVRLDTSRAERDLSAFVKKAEGVSVRLKGIDSKKFTQPLGRITGSVSEFNKSLEASNARVIAFTASAGILFGITKAFKEMGNAMIQVEHTLTDINVILGASTRNLKIFSKEMFNVAKGTGQSFFEVGKAATEFSRQGLTMEKTLLRTRDALILTRLSGMDAEAAVNSLTAAINSFNKTALDSTTIINKLANVDAAFAVSSRDLAEAIKRVASTAQSVNVDFDQLIAVVTSAQQTTARGGNVIGNSLKTIFTRIQRTEVIGQLERLGVAVRTASGEMRPAMTVLGELAKKYDKLSGQQKSYTAELVGGVYQMNILKAILKDLGNEYSIYNSALETSKNTTDEAIRRNEELNRTLSATLNKALENLREFGAEAGKMTLEPALKRILGTFNKLSEETTLFGDIGKMLGFDEKEAKGFGKRVASGIMESIGNFLSGPGMIMMGTVAAKLLMDFGKFLSKATVDFVGLNKNAQQQAIVQNEINDILKQNPKLIDSIVKGEKTQLQVEREIVQALKDQVLQKNQLEALSRKMAAGAIAGGISARIDKSAGTSSITTKSGGFIPNFRDMGEYVGALQGGYKPGNERRSYVPGEGMMIWNDAEKKKKFPGMQQAAIMPPRTSKAGDQYEKDFGEKWGFNPYAAQGFIPNFKKVNTDFRRKATMLIPTPDAKGTAMGRAGGRTYKFKLRGPDSDKLTDKGSKSFKDLEKKMKTSMDRMASGLAASLNPPLESKTKIKPSEYFNKGAVRGAMGTVFEAAIDSAFKRNPDVPKNQLWDVPPGKGSPELSALFGYKGGPADYKVSTTKGNRGSFAKKIAKHWGITPLASPKKGKAEGFVPNLMNVLTSLRLGTTEKASNLKGGSMIKMKGSSLASNVPKQLGKVMRYILKPNEMVRIQTQGSFALSEAQRAGLPSSKGGGNAGQAKGRAQEKVIRGMKGMRAPVKGSGREPDLPYDAYHTDSKGRRVPIESKTITRQKGRGARMETKDLANVFVKSLYENSSHSLRQVRSRLSASSQQDPYAKELSSSFEKNLANQFRYRANELKEYTGQEMSLQQSNANVGFDVKNWQRSNRGFVPNFSAKLRAMQTERSLGGVPEYREFPFPHVADRRTQKNWGDVMRDHPEGVGRAMKNSARAQGSARSRGFIPNFQEGSSGLEGGLGLMTLGMAAMSAKELADSMSSLKDEADGTTEKMAETKKAHEDGIKAMKDAREAKIKEAETSRDVTKKDANLEGKTKTTSRAGAAERKKRKDLGLVDEKGNLLKAGSKEEKDMIEGKTSRRNKRGTKGLSATQKKGLEQQRERLKNLKAEKAIAKRRVQVAEQNVALSKRLTAKDKEALQQSKKQRDQAKTASGKAPKGRMGRMGSALGKNPFGAMMMLTAGAGMARGFAGKSKGANAAIDVGESTAQWASMGAMLGPKGAAAGAAIGLLMGVVKASEKLNDPLPKMKKGMEDAREALNKFNNASTSYLSAAEKWNQAFDEPGMTGTELAKRKNAFEDAFLELPDGVRTKIAEAAGETDKIKQILSEAGKELSEVARQLEGQVHIQQKIQDNRSGFWNSTKRFFGGEESQMFDDTATGRKDLNDVFTSIWKEVDNDKLKGAGGQAIKAQMDAAFKAASQGRGVGQLASVLKKLNVDPNFIEQVKSMGKNTKDAAKLAGKFNEKLLDTIKGLKEFEASEKIASQLRAVSKIYNDSMRENIKQQELGAAVMKNVIEREKQRIFHLNKLSTMRDTHRMNMALEGTKGALNLAKPFMGQRSTKEFESEIKVREIQKKQLIDIQGAITKGIQNSFKVVNDQLNRTSSELLQQFKQLSTGKPIDSRIRDEMAQNRQIQEALMPLMVKHLESIANDPRTVGIPDEVIKGMEDAVVKAVGPAGKQRAKLIIAELIKGNMATENKLGEIIMGSNMQLAIAREQLFYQKKQVELQERLETLGGAGDFLGAAGKTGLSSQASKIVPLLEQLHTSTYGIRIKIGESVEQQAGMVDQGRASFQIMDDLLNNLKLRGEGGRRLGVDDLGELPGMAMRGRMEDLRMQTELRRMMASLTVGRDLSKTEDKSGLAESFRKALDKTNLRRTAASQISNQLKLENMPQEMADLRASSEVLGEIMHDHSATFQQKNEVAFENALRNVGLHALRENWANITGRSTDKITHAIGDSATWSEGKEDGRQGQTLNHMTKIAEVNKTFGTDIAKSASENTIHLDKNAQARHGKAAAGRAYGHGLQSAGHILQGKHATRNDHNLNQILLAMTHQRDLQDDAKNFVGGLDVLKDKLKGAATSGGTPPIMGSFNVPTDTAGQFMLAKQKGLQRTQVTSHATGRMDMPITESNIALYGMPKNRDKKSKDYGKDITFKDLYEEHAQKYLNPTLADLSTPGSLPAAYSSQITNKKLKGPGGHVYRQPRTGPGGPRRVGLYGTTRANNRMAGGLTMLTQRAGAARTPLGSPAGTFGGLFSHFGGDYDPKMVGQQAITDAGKAGRSGSTQFLRKQASSRAVNIQMEREAKARDKALADARKYAQGLTISKEIKKGDRYLHPWQQQAITNKTIGKAGIGPPGTYTKDDAARNAAKRGNEATRKRAAWTAARALEAQNKAAGSQKALNARRLEWAAKVDTAVSAQGGTGDLSKVDLSKVFGTQQQFLFSADEQAIIDETEKAYVKYLTAKQKYADAIKAGSLLTKKEVKAAEDALKIQRDGLKMSNQQLLKLKNSVAVGGGILGDASQETIAPYSAMVTDKDYGHGWTKYKKNEKTGKLEPDDERSYTGFMDTLSGDKNLSGLYHPSSKRNINAMYQASILDLRRKGSLSLGADPESAAKEGGLLNALGLQGAMGGGHTVNVRDEKFGKVTKSSLEIATQQVGAGILENLVEVERDGKKIYVPESLVRNMGEGGSDQLADVRTGAKDKRGVKTFKRHWAGMDAGQRAGYATQAGIVQKADEKGQKIEADADFNKRVEQSAREAYTRQAARVGALEFFKFNMRHHLEQNEQMKKIFELEEQLMVTQGNTAEAVAKRKKILEKLAQIELDSHKLETDRNQANVDRLLASKTAFAGEKAAAVKAQNLRKIREGRYTVGDTFKAIGESWKYGTKEMNRDTDKLMTDVSGSFKSGISSAFSEAIKGTKSLKESFSDMFGSISTMIQQQIIEMFVNRYIMAPMGAMMSGGGGGTGKARGGFIAGGSGVRDDIPAMLTGGEYVVRKSSVNKYGKDFFDQLNEGRSVNRNVGGLAMVLGLTAYQSRQANKDTKADKKRKEREAKRMAHHKKLMDEARAKGLTPGTIETDPQWKAAHGDLNQGNYVKVAKKNAFLYDDPMFATMKGSRLDVDKTLSRRALMDEDNSMNAFRQEKQSTLWDFRKQKAENHKAWKEQMDDWREGKKNAMKGALISAGMSMAMGYMQDGSLGFSTDEKKNVWGKTKRGWKSFKTRLKPDRADDWAKSVNPGRYNSYQDLWDDGDGMGYYQQGTNQWIPFENQLPKSRAGWSWDNPVPADNFRGNLDKLRSTKPAWRGSPIRRDRLARGGHSQDDVAALLMGGEYVVNKDVVNRHGVDFFDKLNSGELPKFEEGGLVGGEDMFGKGGSGGLGQTNNINITVNVTKDGESIVSVSSDGKDQDEGKILADQIRKQVVNVIISQKRQGGLLYNSGSGRRTSG